MLIFQANFPKNRASNKGPRILKKINPGIMQNHLEFVTSSEF